MARDIYKGYSERRVIVMNENLALWHIKVSNLYLCVARAALNVSSKLTDIAEKHTIKAVELAIVSTDKES